MGGWLEKGRFSRSSHGRALKVKVGDPESNRAPMTWVSLLVLSFSNRQLGSNEAWSFLVMHLMCSLLQHGRQWHQTPDLS